MADALFLSLWFPSFELDEMLPRALAVMRQFPFSAVQPGISYVAIHPVSWNEPTIFEQRFRPGLAPEEAALLASDLLHEDYAYMFEGFWDLWVFDANQQQWTLQPSKVKFLVHGVDFDDGVYIGIEGHVEVDFGIDSPFLQDEVQLDSEAETRVRANVQNVRGFHQQGGEGLRRKWTFAVVRVGGKLCAETDCPTAESAVVLSNGGRASSPGWRRATHPSSIVASLLGMTTLFGSSAFDF